MEKRQKIKPILALVLAAAITACGGGGGSGSSSPGGGQAGGQGEEQGSQKDAHPDFYDSGLRKKAADTILVVETGKSVPNGLFTAATAFKADSARSYFSTDESAIKSDSRTRRPQGVRIFNNGTSAAENSSIRLTLDADGKIVQTVLSEGGYWEYPVVKDSGFTKIELGATGIPERWLGTWVSSGDSGISSTNDWSMMHVDDERVVLVDMFSEASTANPKINLACVVRDVWSPQAFMEQAIAPKTERINGVNRAVYIRISGQHYEKKMVPSQARSSTNFTQNNYEDFDISKLKYGLYKRKSALRSELCNLTISELNKEQLAAYKGADLLSGLTPELYEGFDWDQCLGLDGDEGKECREKVQRRQDEIDAKISRSVSDIWRETYPTVTKSPFDIYDQEYGDGNQSAVANICDFSDPDCVLIYSLLRLQGQKDMLKLSDMSYLKVPEVQALFAQFGIVAVPESLYAKRKEALEDLNQSIDALRIRGMLPETGVDVVFPSDLADPLYDVKNSEIAVDQLEDYRYALNSYRDQDNSNEVRKGVVEAFFGRNATSLNGVLNEDVGGEVALDVQMRREQYEYNDWLAEISEQQQQSSNAGWSDYRQDTGTQSTSDSDNLAFLAWCSDHPGGCGCPNYSCVSEDNTCACSQ